MKSHITTEPFHTIVIKVNETERKLIVELLKSLPQNTQKAFVTGQDLIEAFQLPPEEAQARK